MYSYIYKHMRWLCQCSRKTSTTAIACSVTAHSECVALQSCLVWLWIFVSVIINRFQQVLFLIFVFLSEHCCRSVSQSLTTFICLTAAFICWKVSSSFQTDGAVHRKVLAFSCLSEQTKSKTFRDLLVTYSSTEKKTSNRTTSNMWCLHAIHTSSFPTPFSSKLHAPFCSPGRRCIKHQTCNKML